MSECVVRMEVPENCYECDIYLSAFINCPVYSVAGGYQNRHKYIKCRHPDCPICAILPENHGRLGDLDALCEGLVSNHAVVIYAKNAPTIVPAERIEKDGTD